MSRFAPIVDSEGRRVPVLYAGHTFDVAAYESLFHAIGPGQEMLTWPASGLTGLAHSILETRRDLDVVPLFRRNLIGWNVSDLEIIKAPARYYHQTARWAEAVHRSIAEAAGMVWISNREGSDLSGPVVEAVRQDEFSPLADVPSNQIVLAARLWM